MSGSAKRDEIDLAIQRIDLFFLEGAVTLTNALERGPDYLRDPRAFVKQLHSAAELAAVAAHLRTLRDEERRG